MLDLFHHGIVLLADHPAALAVVAAIALLTPAMIIREARRG